MAAAGVAIGIMVAGNSVIGARTTSTSSNVPVETRCE